MSQCRVIGTPAPQTWDDYERGCLATYGGGYRTKEEIAIFHHGIATVFNLLRHEFPQPEQIKNARERADTLDQLNSENYARALKCESWHDRLVKSVKDLRTVATDLRGEIVVNGSRVDAATFMRAFEADDAAQAILEELGIPTNEQEEHNGTPT